MRWDDTQFNYLSYQDPSIHLLLFKSIPKSWTSAPRASSSKPMTNSPRKPLTKPFNTGRVRINADCLHVLYQLTVTSNTGRARRYQSYRQNYHCNHHQTPPANCNYGRARRHNRPRRNQCLQCAPGKEQAQAPPRRYGMGPAVGCGPGDGGGRGCVCCAGVSAGWSWMYYGWI